MNTLSGSQKLPKKFRFIDSDHETEFNDEWKKLLLIAFEKADSIRILKRLSGYSGAQTWSIQTQTGPTLQLFVVKFDEPKFLQREYEKATDDVTGGALFGNPVTPDGEIVQIPGNRWALMKSTLRGMAKSDTLFEHLQIEGAVNIERILRSVFMRDSRLRANIQEGPVIYSTYYDRLLPEHFRFNGLKGVDENAHKIEASKLQPRYLEKIEKEILKERCNVELRNFYLEKTKPQVWTLRPDQPVGNQPPRIRIKYRPAEGQSLPTENEQGAISSLFGQNPQSRLDLLCNYATDVLRGVKTDKKTFTYRNVRFPNPLYFLSSLLAKQDDLKITLIHGDLNLRNILIAIHKDDQGNVIDIKDWLIDFADTDMGPVLLDLQWLEVQVILWLLAPAIHKAQRPVTILVDFFLALHECQNNHTAHLNSHLQTAYTVIRQIRLLAQEYLVTDWSEYYHGLVLALLGALRLSESVTDFHDYVPRVTFLSAAIVLSWASAVPADDLKLISPQLQPPPRFVEPQPPVAPHIDSASLPELIWSNQPFSIKGTAAPKATVLLTVNQENAATIVADKGGNWQASFSLLHTGSYQLVTKDKGTGAESVPLVIFVKASPQIDQTSIPREIFARKKFVLTGTAHPRSTVQLIANGQTLASPIADDSGCWKAEVVLNEDGKSTISVRDEASDVASDQILVIIAKRKSPALHLILPLVIIVFLTIIAFMIRPTVLYNEINNGWQYVAQLLWSSPTKLVIGVAVAGRGDGTLIGDTQSIGIRSALNFFEDDLDKMNVEIVVKSLDATSKESGAIKAFKELVDENVLAIFGPSYSTQVKTLFNPERILSLFNEDEVKSAFNEDEDQVKPFIEQLKQILLFGMSNTADTIAELSPYNLRVSSGTKVYAGYAPSYVINHNQNINKVALVYLHDSFTETEAEAFRSTITKEEGRNLVIDERYEMTNTEYARVVDLICKTTCSGQKIDLVIISSRTPDGVAIIKLLKAKGYTGKIIGGNGLNVPGIFSDEICGEPCLGIYIAQAYNYDYGNENSVNQKFIKIYDEEIRRLHELDPARLRDLPKPSQLTAQAFTAVQVFIEALKKVNDQTVTPINQMTRQELRDAINEQLLNHVFDDTPLGRISFNNDGEITQEIFCVAVLRMENKQGRFDRITDSGLGCD